MSRMPAHARLRRHSAPRGRVLGCALALVVPAAGVLHAAEPSGRAYESRAWFEVHKGRQAALAGDFHGAEERLARAEARAYRLADRSTELAARLLRVGLRLAGEEWDSAGALLPPLHRGMPRLDSASWHLVRGRLRLGAGDADAARGDFDRAVQAGACDPELHLLALLGAARARAVQGDLPAAHELLGRAALLLKDAPAFRPQHLLERGRLARMADDPDAAKRLSEAVDALREAGDSPGVLAALAELGLAESARAHVEEALDAYDRAAALAVSIGLPRPAARLYVERALLDRGAERGASIERARRILGQAGLDARSLGLRVEAQALLSE